VDQSSSDLFRGGIAIDQVFPILDISIPSENIRGRSLKLLEILPNFAHFLASKFFGGEQPPSFGTQII